MTCSMFQQMCSASTHIRGSFTLPPAPSKLHKPAAEGSHIAARQALNFRSSSYFQNQDANGNFPPRYRRQRSDAGRSNNTIFLVKAVTGAPLKSDHESSSSGPKSSWESVKHNIDVFSRFTRPYALLGRGIGVVSMSVLAMEKLSDFSPLFVKGVLKALVATGLMSVYVNGVNQVSDIEIDKVNKPYLPLASGEYSYTTGVLITVISAILSFCIGWTEGSLPLLYALFGMFFIGTVYSLNTPLLRWKKNGFLAAACIVGLLGIDLPVPNYLHFQTHLLHKPAVFSKSLMFTTAFMSLFSLTIALFKDIPDIEGDKIFGIQSYTSRLGQKQVFWICISLLEMAYGAAIFVGTMSPNMCTKLAMTLGHGILGVVLWNRAKRTDLMNQKATQGFYMFLWKLFYAEYLLIPFVRF